MTYKRWQGLEKDFQKEVAKYLNAKGVTWCHVPNEMKAIKPWYYKIRESYGVKKGVSDVLIFTSNSEYNGFAIELKAGYNKPSKEQLKWLEALKKEGWKTLVSYSLDEVIIEINNYLNIKDHK